MLDFRVGSILRKRQTLEQCSDTELRHLGKRLFSLALGGKSLSRLLVDSFALGIEATRRVLGKTHYPVQVHAGIQIFRGNVVQMQTGEGKTITAVLPVILRAYTGAGVHVLTSNEYLALRDANQLRPVYELVGLSVGAVSGDMDDAAREVAYSMDVTYTTAGEIGFDFLRDSMKRGQPEQSDRRQNAARPVLRGFHFAMVDEADSILIDDARTPLIIGSERSEQKNKNGLCMWADEFAPSLVQGKDFILDSRKKTVDLTEFGCRKVLLSRKPQELTEFNNEQIFQHIEQALVARRFYQRERDYLVMEDNSVVIVDEGTGRVMEERKWQQGLHQAIEAKEKVSITSGNSTAARVTLQSLFRRYQYLAGMTGTAMQVRSEIRKVYRVGTSVIPTHRPCIRRMLPTRIFLDVRSKHEAVTQSVHRHLENDRAILIGTPSVDSSELLSAHLRRAGIHHEVLNCRSHGREAEIVSQAGKLRSVTIATNMAGRGTDILLDPLVRKAGGLHVIATERHTSARIDRQLIGRCARQGDPGSYEFLLSVEDELFRSMNSLQHQRLCERASRFASASGELPSSFESVFIGLQRAIERQHARSRRQLFRQEKNRLKEFVKMSIDPHIEFLGD
jgi:preprotein translocase subunit SecA